MLQIEDLQVKVGDKEILKHIDLEIHQGETHVLFGPNGSGKTSLLMTIMGYPQYRVTGGKISFKGEDITDMPVNERAQLGIGVSYQRPPTIHGVKTRKMVEICAKGKVDAQALAEKVNFSEFLERDINAGFSGGEIKRSVKVVAKGLDRHGGEVRIKGEELMAHALEHEIDHLNGVLYINHLESADKLSKLEPGAEVTEI